VQVRRLCLGLRILGEGVLDYGASGFASGAAGSDWGGWQPGSGAVVTVDKRLRHLCHRRWVEEPRHRKQEAYEHYVQHADRDRPRRPIPALLPSGLVRSGQGRFSKRKAPRREGAQPCSCLAVRADRSGVFRTEGGLAGRSFLAISAIRDTLRKPAVVLLTRLHILRPGSS